MHINNLGLATLRPTSPLATASPMLNERFHFSARQMALQLCTKMLRRVSHLHDLVGQL